MRGICLPRVSQCLARKKSFFSYYVIVKTIFQDLALGNLRLKMMDVCYTENDLIMLTCFDLKTLLEIKCGPDLSFQ